MNVFYTDRLIPSGFAAYARGPIIFIRPQYKDDPGILAHERVHVRQWLSSLGLHSFLYPLAPAYRLWSEVQAYREQARHYTDDRLPLFAQMIATSYALDITPEAVLALLMEK